MTLASRLRRGRRWFGGRSRSGASPLAGHAGRYATARLLVRAYYAALLYLAFASAPALGDLAAVGHDRWLWPVAWIPTSDPATAGLIVLALSLVGALAAAVFPDSRAARTLAAVGLLEFTALSYSGGKIGHGMHLWVITSWVLVLLPHPGPRLGWRQRQDYLNVFWTAHALVFLTYSMSGLGKIFGAIYQGARGETTIFHPQALALHVAERLQQTGSTNAAGAWLVDHVWAGWPLMLGLVYLQTFAFWAIFRPSLIRGWTVALIAFHVATFLVLSIKFAPAILLLGLWGLASPFSPPRATLAMALEDLPVLGNGWRWLWWHFRASGEWR